MWKETLKFHLLQDSDEGQTSRNIWTESHDRKFKMFMQILMKYHNQYSRVKKKEYFSGASADGD